jgi:hypothetical protein
VLAMIVRQHLVRRDQAGSGRSPGFLAMAKRAVPNEELLPARGRDFVGNGSQSQESPCCLGPLCRCHVLIGLLLYTFLAARVILLAGDYDRHRCGAGNEQCLEYPVTHFVSIL